MAGQEIVETREVPTFIKKKHELAKLLKEVQKVSPDAVELIKNTMLDAAVDIKLRVQCAETLTNLEVKVANQINSDELAQKIAEIKVNGPVRNLTADSRAKASNTPTLNFEDIREVD